MIIQYLCHKINKKNGRGLKILFLASVAVFSRDTHEAGPTPSLPTNHLKTVFHRLVHVLDLNVFFSPVQAISLWLKANQCHFLWTNWKQAVYSCANFSCICIIIMPPTNSHRKNSTVINCVTASTMYCSVSFADVIRLQLKIAHEEPVSGKPTNP